MFSVAMSAAALTVSQVNAQWNVELPANTTLSSTTTYNEAGNWVGGIINDTFIDSGGVNPGNPAFIYFTANYTTGSNAGGVAGRGLHLGYGNFT
ncbi:MAG: hypothetical protein LBD30_05145, partial [Verrucomicrobiales bacterium]|nr:hypothetical protein [Verrucomicrobiales bacterium]